jgi:hypothetical protein
VNEHLTSQCCPSCEGRLVDDRTVGVGDQIGRYKRCDSEHCNGRVWQRDLVGATNILKAFVHLVLYGERPQCLRARCDAGTQSAAVRAAKSCVSLVEGIVKLLTKAKKLAWRPSSMDAGVAGADVADAGVAGAGVAGAGSRATVVAIAAVAKSTKRYKYAESTSIASTSTSSV